MFHREGSDRTDRDNRLLAGYLALVAGFVNSASFIYVGFRYWRGRLAHAGRVRLTVGASRVRRPHGPKSSLLVTVFGAFVFGSGNGAVLAARMGRTSLLVPASILFAGALYALFSPRDLVGAENRK